MKVLWIIIRGLWMLIFGWLVWAVIVAIILSGLLILFGLQY